VGHTGTFTRSPVWGLAAALEGLRGGG